MSDPKRWLVNATDQERSVIRAGRVQNLEPPDGAEEQIWKALAGAIGPTGGDGGGHGPGTGEAATKVFENTAAKAVATMSTVLAKWALIGVVGGVATVGAWEGVTRSKTEPVVQGHHSVANAPSGELPMRVVESPEISVEVVPVSSGIRRAESPRPDRETPVSGPISSEAAPILSAVPSAQVRVSDREEERASRLREESLLLGQVRAAVRSGDSAKALTLLDIVRVQYPDGILHQEREALAIEALFGAGQRAAAVERARRFVEIYPRSPYSEQVRGLIERAEGASRR